MYKPSEADIKKQVKDWLKYNGWFVFHVLQGFGSFRGIPDLIAVKEGLVLFIECKREGNTLTTDQRKFKDEVEKHGGIYITAYGIGDVIDRIYQERGEI
jgi:Holliday junction resolvase